jgi:transcriptional regulator with XRE-family HTH domain
MLGTRFERSSSIFLNPLEV